MLKIIDVISKIIGLFTTIYGISTTIYNRNKEIANYNNEIYNNAKIIHELNNSNNISKEESIYNSVINNIRNGIKFDGRKAHAFSIDLNLIGAVFGLSVLLLSTLHNTKPEYYATIALFSVSAFVAIGLAFFYDKNTSYISIKFDTNNNINIKDIPMISEKYAIDLLNNYKIIYLIDIRLERENLVNMIIKNDDTNVYRYYNMDFRKYHSKKSVNKYIDKNNLDKSFEFIVAGINYDRCDIVARYLRDSHVDVKGIVGPISHPATDWIDALK